MKALLLGGDGYVGRYLQRASRVLTDPIVADLRPLSRCPVSRRTATSPRDVGRRRSSRVDRAPRGDPPRAGTRVAREYYETNVTGARNIAAYADAVGCRNIFFMSSTSPYGSTNGPNKRGLCRATGLGVRDVQAGRRVLPRGLAPAGDGRRLVICRPGVIYGPGESGNITRMIRAVRGGYFVLPGDRSVRKSYAYVEGLIESIDFTLTHPESGMCSTTTRSSTPRRSRTSYASCRTSSTATAQRRPSPRHVLVGAAYAFQAATYGRSQLHPTRVRKASIPTHVVPRWLLDHGFEFRYDFRTSLRHSRQSPHRGLRSPRAASVRAPSP